MPISIKRPVERKKLSETVEEELELMIRQGEIAEGEALPSERDLMAAFGVGRPSIRDAETHVVPRCGPAYRAYERAHPRTT